MLLKGRLGLETTNIPQADRHGLLWLERGKITVDSGNLLFSTAGTDALKAGAYQLPLQQVSNVLLGPGTLISHDALRVLARQKTGLLAVGSNGIRLYAVSMPFGPDRAALARKQAALWSDKDTKIDVVRKMYSMRFGSDLPSYARDLNSLRGIEGKRMKQVYQRLSEQYAVNWNSRSYDRSNPEKDDAINNAINHAATATYAAAQIAVSVAGAIPQLGFIHESSGRAFALDIADLFRSSLTLPIAFAATKKAKNDHDDVEKLTRMEAGKTFKKDKIINEMIEKISEVLDIDDHSRNA